MALFFPGHSKCVLCEKVIDRQSPVVAFPAFLPPNHRFARFSDGVFHQSCFEEWEGHQEFQKIYGRFEEIWDSRPRDLTTLEEMEEWGKRAFQEFDEETDG
jgi:hypothetical protein